MFYLPPNLEKERRPGCHIDKGRATRLLPSSPKVGSCGLQACEDLQRTCSRCPVAGRHASQPSEPGPRGEAKLASRAVCGGLWWLLSRLSVPPAVHSGCAASQRS